MKNFKSGFVAIIGSPNVGKSTLLNTIMKQKIAIVTHKAQTTRNKIQGIYNDTNSQIILMDTPGIHDYKNYLGKYMNKVALKSLKNADLVLYMVSVKDLIKNNFIIQQLRHIKIPIALVLSKIDLINNNNLLKDKINHWNNIFSFKKIIPISSKENKNINLLISYIKDVLPNGPKYFSDENYTDQPEKFLIGEIIREKILLLTKQEIPYSIAIIITKIEDKKDLMKIYASIVVEKASQKPIVIGKNGKLIKEIGILAREELEKVFNTKIYLDLFVKIEEKWREKENLLKKMGYSKNSY